MKPLYLLFLFLGCSVLGGLSAQSLSIFEEPGISRLLEQRRKLNFDPDRYIKVWSVQIMISRDKLRVMERKREVKRRFSHDISVEWSYEQPYYKLNAGAFFTKLEAAGLLRQLIDIYPEAYIFKNGQAHPAHMEKGSVLDDE